MMDRDHIRRYLFGTYSIRMDANDPLMHALLMHEALWVQQAETLGLLVQKMQSTIEDIYVQAGQESKALGTEVIVAGAKVEATEISQSVSGGF